MLEQRTIRLRTEIPGPKSRAYLERRRAVVSRAVSEGIPICVDHAAGSTVTDVDGNHFLDFTGGIGVLNVGHVPPSVRDAITEQAGRLLHTCFMVAGYEPYVGLCEDLVALVPGDFEKKVVLANSGAEAVETAVKIARAATGRDAVIVFSHAYHGRTLLTLTMTAKHRNYKRGFGPFAPEIYRAPLPFAYGGVSVDDAARAVDQLVDVEVGAERIAAIVIEPVAGEGGYIPVQPRFLAHLRALCDRTGAVLVLDEVQTGFGRTGTMFAVEQSGIDADLLCVAKSLAAGMPLAAVVGRAELMDAPLPGGLGGTYSGNPVACAAARASLALMRAPAYLERAVAIGETVRERFTAWQAGLPLIGDVRSAGPMAALELVADRVSRAPASQACADVVRRAYERGLILVRAGLHDNVIRFIAPLVITDRELNEGLNVLRGALEEVSHGARLRSSGR
jgi:4-aminobutyrate aminotransferase/(S)-3-amino-2-methylpropionate transaminase